MSFFSKSAVALLLFLPFTLAFSASLFISPSSGTYEKDDIITVNIVVSSTDKVINAVEGELVFSADKLEFLSYSKSGSIIDFWPLEPSLSAPTGTLSFEGVVVETGFSGPAGQILSLAFRVRDSVGSANLSIQNARVLAHDGEGTEVPSTFSGANYVFIYVEEPVEPDAPVLPGPDDVVTPPVPITPEPVTPPEPPEPPEPVEPVVPVDPDVDTPLPEPQEGGFSAVARAVNDVVNDIKRAMSDPVTSGVADIVTKTGAVAGAASALTVIFLNPMSLAELFLLPLRLWTALMSFFGLKRRYRPWGTVYDSVTKQPLDPAIVTLIDKSGTQVGLTITDIDGRYGFFVEPGEYTINARKTHYIFPSEKLSGKRSDNLYGDLYFGGSFELEEGETVTKNIPLDQQAFDWNEQAKRRSGLMNFYSAHEPFLVAVLDVLFIVGFGVSVVATFVAPHFYNFGILGLYVFIAVLRMIGIKPKTYGRLVSKKTKKPLSFASVSVMRSGVDREMRRIITDAYGRYYCLVNPGSYYLKIETKDKNGEVKETYYTDDIPVRKGVLNRSLTV
jgi:hypothetical protein